MMILFYNLITMKKYRLLKDLPFHKKWMIFLYDWKQAFEEWDMEHPIALHYFDDISFKVLLWEWFEEVKEEPKPKFKIWDYVVYEWESIEYIKIYNIKKSWTNFIYNQTPTSYWFFICYYEANLRLPNKEELKKYFR